MNSAAAAGTRCPHLPPSDTTEPCRPYVASLTHPDPRRHCSVGGQNRRLLRSLTSRKMCLLGCNPVHVEKYGVVEAEGTLGYHSARIGLRAPRVAVRVESAHHWQSMFGLAMWTAASWWGGYGFIYLPRGTGRLHPALARILGAYDPDYLVDALWTQGDIDALEPGWHARHNKGWPTDPDKSAALLAQPFAEQVVCEGLGEDIGANLCSPYYEPPGYPLNRSNAGRRCARVSRETGLFQSVTSAKSAAVVGHSCQMDSPDEPYDEQGRFRRMRVLSPPTDRNEHSLAAVLGGNPRADFEVPEGLDPLLTLALGLRVGYPSKPPLPLGREVHGVGERLPHRYVNHALCSRQDRPGLELRGLTTAWNLTQAGLVKIGKVGPPARPIAVIGSTAEDFALAVALDRMYGTTTWVPVEWVKDSGLRWPVQEGYRDLLQAASPSGHPPIVTSISLSEEQLNTAVQASWPAPIQAWDDNGNTLSLEGDPPEVIPAQQLDLGTPMHLACAPADYDLPFTSPTRADGRGGFEFLLPIPVHAPSTEELRSPRRPFWEVDVEVYPPRMPSGRNLRARAILADGDAYPSTVLRSGRDGISFNPMNMLFVPGGATLEQSVTRPRLRVLGLRGWIEALAAQDQPDTDVQLSQAGRRAMILTRLWGSRSAVARDLLALNDFLREFKPSGSSDTQAYGNRDGVRLTSTEGYLTLAAAVRTLPEMETGEIRDRLNHLLHINVLRRGLIVPCSECERRAFYRIELLGEINTCPRCGAPAYMTAARRSERGEPEWFYDLHGAVRELLEQNGDVPFLAGMALAATTRSFEDIAELTPTRTRTGLSTSPRPTAPSRRDSSAPCPKASPESGTGPPHPPTSSRTSPATRRRLAPCRRYCGTRRTCWTPIPGDCSRRSRKTCQCHKTSWPCSRVP